MGPSIVQRLAAHDDQQLSTLIRTGFPDAGMPGQQLPQAELAALV